MEKEILLTGSSDSSEALILAMGTRKLEIKTTQDLNAKTLYDFLNFERGDRFLVKSGGYGKVHKGTFDTFYELLEEVAQKLSGLKIVDLDSASNVGEES